MIPTYSSKRSPFLFTAGIPALQWRSQAKVQSWTRLNPAKIHDTSPLLKQQVIISTSVAEWNPIDPHLKALLYCTRTPADSTSISPYRQQYTLLVLNEESKRLHTLRDERDSVGCTRYLHRWANSLSEEAMSARWNWSDFYYSYEASSVFHSFAVDFESVLVMCRVWRFWCLPFQYYPMKDSAAIDQHSIEKMCVWKGFVGREWIRWHASIECTSVD